MELLHPMKVLLVKVYLKSTDSKQPESHLFVMNKNFEYFLIILHANV